MNREPIKIIGDIIKNYLNLNDNQILIYNQDFKIPATKGLFILLQYNTSQPYSVVNKFIPAAIEIEGAEESVSVLMKEDYTINVVSKNDEARQRKEEILMAFNSNYSQEQQGLYQFQIAKISNSFINISELEGAGMLNRFAINISLLAHYNRINDIAYYDTFTNQIENN